MEHGKMTKPPLLDTNLGVYYLEEAAFLNKRNH